MQALGLDPQNVLLVGDMIADVQLAQALGAQCVLVPWGHNSRERLAATGCPIAGSCEELLERIIKG